MPLLEHTITTSAPPSVVWAVLEDIDGWGDWNTVTVARCDGFEVTKTVRLRITQARNLAVDAAFVQVERERFLVWQGGVPGIFGARHGFDLQPTDDGSATAAPAARRTRFHCRGKVVLPHNQAVDKDGATQARCCLLASLGSIGYNPRLQGAAAVPALGQKLVAELP